MANKHAKNPGNAPGRFYVDDTCIDCDLCRTTAEQVYRRDDYLGMSVVFRQPITEEEFRAAQEGMQACPTESIGDDGE